MLATNGSVSLSNSFETSGRLLQGYSSDHTLNPPDPKRFPSSQSRVSPSHQNLQTQVDHNAIAVLGKFSPQPSRRIRKGLPTATRSPAAQTQPRAAPMDQCHSKYHRLGPHGKYLRAVPGFRLWLVHLHFRSRESFCLPQVWVVS